MTYKERAERVLRYTTKIRREPVSCEECGRIIVPGDTVILAGDGERVGKAQRTMLCLDCYD